MHGRLHVAALAAYITLVVLVIAWEAWGAPATPLPRGFWMGLKALPLAVALPWLWRGHPRAHVFAALLLLLYFCDGVAVTYGAARTGTIDALAYGILETALTVFFIGTASLYARFNLGAEHPGTGARKEP